MSVKVKICGITNTADAQAAVEAGADILGFVFHDSSPRRVTIESAAGIAATVPPFILRAGVFVDADAETIFAALQRCGLNLLQFHGSESPDFCRQFGVMSVKAFRIRDAGSLDALRTYNTDAWLLDAYSPDKPGGTGERFDWDLALEANKLGRPIFLAGGLTPDNVGEAVRRVRPFGVDVSSGVEAVPGRKDHQKVKDFIKAAKSALPGA
jgi:phosphoribosylanthranilate isomerase